MNVVKKIFGNKKEPPCDKCPYTLGLVTFVVSPCPKCEMDNYYMYDRLTKNPYEGYGDTKKE